MNNQDLKYSLIGKPNPLWINKMPPSPQEPPTLDIAFEVTWPNRSVWEGTCPTTQQLDFFIIRRDFENLTWSEGLVFAQVETPIFIPGPSSIVYKINWVLDPARFTDEGAYILEATFIATGHKETQNLEIKFAHQQIE